VIATANANPTPVRIALRAATERVARNPFAILLTATGFREQPVGGARLRQPHAKRPGPYRPGVGRCCGGDHPAGQVDRRRDRAAPKQSPPEHHRILVVFGGEHRADVLAVASPRHGTQFGQFGVQFLPVDGLWGHERSVERAGAAPQHRDHRRLQVGRPHVIVIAHPISQPLQVLDHTHKRAAASRQAHRPVVGAHEVLFQRAHCARHLVARSHAVEPIGQRRAYLRDVTAQIVAVAGGKQEQRRRHANGQRNSPPQQPRGDRSGERAHRKHVQQQRNALTRRDRITEHPGQRHRHTEDESQCHGQPRERLHQRADRYQHRPVESKTAIPQRTCPPIAGQIDEPQQPDCAKQGE